MTDREIIFTAECQGMRGARVERTDKYVSLLIGDGEETRGIDFIAEGLRPEHIRSAVALFKGRVAGNG